MPVLQQVQPAQPRLRARVRVTSRCRLQLQLENIGRRAEAGAHSAPFVRLFVLMHAHFLTAARSPRYYTRMLDLIKNSSADSQQLLAQVSAACEYRPPFCSASCALLCDSPQIVPVPVVMHEVKKYCRTL